MMGNAEAEKAATLHARQAYDRAMLALTLKADQERLTAIAQPNKWQQVNQ